MWSAVSGGEVGDAEWRPVFRVVVGDSKSGLGMYAADGLRRVVQLQTTVDQILVWVFPRDEAGICTTENVSAYKLCST